MFCGKCERPYSVLRTSGQLPRVLSCGHAYCTECIANWLSSSSSSVPSGNHDSTPSSSSVKSSTAVEKNNPDLACRAQSFVCGQCMQPTTCTDVDELPVHETLCAWIQVHLESSQTLESKHSNVCSKSESMMTNNTCKRHSLPCDLFCKTCRRLVCVHCRDYDGTHQNGKRPETDPSKDIRQDKSTHECPHECVLAKDEWIRMQPVKQYELQALAKERNTYAEWESTAQRTLQTLETRYLAHQGQLDEQERQWIQAIRARKQQLMQVLTERHTQHMQECVAFVGALHERRERWQTLWDQWNQAQDETALPMVEAWKQARVEGSVEQLDLWRPPEPKVENKDSSSSGANDSSSSGANHSSDAKDSPTVPSPLVASEPIPVLYTRWIDTNIICLTPNCDEWWLSTSTPPQHISIRPRTCIEEEEEEKTISPSGSRTSWPHFASVLDMTADALHVSWTLPKGIYDMGPSKLVERVQTEVQVAYVDDQEWPHVSSKTVLAWTDDQKWTQLATTDETSLVLTGKHLADHKVVLVRVRTLVTLRAPPDTETSHLTSQIRSVWSPAVSHSVPWVLRNGVYELQRYSVPSHDSSSWPKEWTLCVVPAPVMQMGDSLWKFRITSVEGPRSFRIGFCFAEVTHSYRDGYKIWNIYKEVADPGQTDKSHVYEQLYDGDELWVRYKRSTNTLHLSCPNQDRVNWGYTRDIRPQVIVPPHAHTPYGYSKTYLFVATKGKTQYTVLKE